MPYSMTTTSRQKQAMLTFFWPWVPRLTWAPLGIFEASVFSAYLAAFTACCMVLVSSLFRKANLTHQEGSGGGQARKLLRQVLGNRRRRSPMALAA